MSSAESSMAGMIPGGEPAEGPPRMSFVGSGRGGMLGADLLLESAAKLSGLFVIVMLGALLVVLTLAAKESIQTFGWKFFTSTDWRANERELPVHGADGKIMLDSDGEPVMEVIPPSFGALPVIYGTAVSSTIALLVAVPLSLGAALFMVRLAPAVIVPSVSFLIEFLAAIPSIAYGLWGLFILAPLLQKYIEPWMRDVLQHVPGLSGMFVDYIKVGNTVVARPMPLNGRDMLCGSLVLAVMILPIITAISRDILRQVPRAQIEGSVALGATWWESCKEMLKYSRSGLFGAVMLGLARAAGETMAVTMVIGNNTQIRGSIFAPAQTMSSLLATQYAEASTPLHTSALCEVALILLVMSLLFNVVARYLVVGKGDSRGARAA
jgi:phosphate transport system permease protein